MSEKSKSTKLSGSVKSKLLSLITSRDFNRRIRCNLVAARYQREIDRLCAMHRCTEEDVIEEVTNGFK